MSATPRLTGLHLHPVKSCRGIALTEGWLTPAGLAHDREWMVVDASGTFVTQREFPRMALIATALGSDTLRLEAPGEAALEIALAGDARPARAVRVWRHATSAFDEGDAAAAWLTRVLGAPLRLVRWDPAQRRLSSLEWTGGVEADNRFSDGYPLLVISEESLGDLNARIGGAPLPMDRFRPNLVIAGVPPYAEDRIRTLRADGIELRIVKPCTRCRITTTDQATAEVGAEPLRTLATYRRDPRFSGPLFGQNVIVAAGAGRALRVGMEFAAE